jgi:IMP cyclohydrolase
MYNIERTHGQWGYADIPTGDTMFGYTLNELHNLELLKRNTYPGRGFIVGVNDAGTHVLQVYWIMGRSESSRNRVFSHDGGRVFTEPADPAKVKDPKDLDLIIYNAMDEWRDDPNVGRGRYFVVSNGRQTDSVVKVMRDGPNLYRDFEDAMYEWGYEPDSPNFTPRITALCSVWPNEQHFQISVVRMLLRGQKERDDCERHYFNYPIIESGLGLCVHTYMRDGKPLPSWHGEPVLMPLRGSQEDVTNQYWATLNEENKVSLAVKFIDVQTGESKFEIRNKYTKVA